MKFDISVRAKLALSCGIAILSLVAVGALAWRDAFRWQDDVQALTRNTQKQAALATAQDAIWTLRWQLGNFMTETDDTKRQRIVDADPDQYSRFEAAMERLGDAASLDAEERAARERLVGTFKRYAESRPKFFQLWRSGDLAQAHEWRANTITTFGAELTTALGELIGAEAKRSLRDSEEASSASTLAKGVIGILVLLAAVLSTAGAVWIGVALLRQLGGEPAYAVDIAMRVAQGDLTAEVKLKDGDTRSVLYALKKMRDDLAEAVRAIQVAAEGVGVGTKEIARGNADLSSRTEEQASTLEETASSMEELTSTVKQNAENARQANQLAVGASDVAARGGEAVRQVVATMNGISDSSRRIADIIGVIDGISFQTNILALNAAVEAARAGEQGRGFAVVAAEVRSLAQRSAGAAKEIKTLIEDSVGRVVEGTRLVDGAGQTMDEIVTSVKRVTDIMSEIAAASQEQLAGIEQVGGAITQMDRVVQQNAALVEESASASENLSAQGDALVNTVARFRIDSSGIDSSARGHAPARTEEAAPANKRASGDRERVAKRAERVEVKRALPKSDAVARASIGVMGDDGDGEWKQF